MKKQVNASYREMNGLENNNAAMRKSETAAQSASNAGISSFRSSRELIETLAIALFLSIIFKFFEAEAYVIPTGSMAPTLMGRHKDVHCQACGYPFQVSASEERDRENRPTESRVLGGTCPQCRLTQEFRANDLSYSGDRVLVNKFIGDFRPVRRWEVTVFRSPPDPKTNYIKRVVGLPNENVRVQYGDLFAQPTDSDGKGEGNFDILRKPLPNLLETLQTVYDNDYQPIPLQRLGWPPRWRDESMTEGRGRTDWQTIDEGKGFYYSGDSVPAPNEAARPFRIETAAAANAPADNPPFKWLRYRHLIPTSAEWRDFARQTVPAHLKRSGVLQNNPQLITDMTAYNTSETASRRTRAASGYNWAGDLALSFVLTPMSGPRKSGEADGTTGEMVLELVKGGTAFHARLNFVRGDVTLEIPSVSEFRPETVPYRFKIGKSYRVLFANIDEQLRLIINGRELPFPNEGKYDRLCSPLSGSDKAILPRNRDPNGLDLTPVSIGTNAPATVRHLKIMRDLYYIALGNHLEPAQSSSPIITQKHLFKFGVRDSFDHFYSKPLNAEDEKALAQFFSTPSLWQDYGNTRSALFRLRGDQYLALGDNSSNSEDCRSWGHPDPSWPDGIVPACVDRTLLLGKAICVYWPHGKTVPGTRLPFIPNFGKMRKID